MSSENFHKFRELVLTDAALQGQLADIPDREEFIAKVLEIADSKGLAFDETVLAEEMANGRREWVERWI